MPDDWSPCGGQRLLLPVKTCNRRLRLVRPHGFRYGFTNQMFYDMSKMIRNCLLGCTLAASAMQAQTLPTAGADERTPSYAQYFSWINNTNEGPTARQTMINLDFFQWLHDRYGMWLDIYAFDAGTIDGAKKYGSTRSARFAEQFPERLEPVSRKAGEMGTRLGVWAGPDGFGDTPEQARERVDMMTELVSKYNFQLFKMDAVCGQLRAEKRPYFDEMMTHIRQISPDFILLNHRLDLGPSVKHSTTFLLGGEETYIDVHMANDVTAPHHRARALDRRAPDNLTRLTEDHGVCLSSCLDYWEDDLVLQAFNRSLILAPEIYANPWLLKDEEFSYLAFIYNLHRQYRDILVDGLTLPEAQYGPGAVSRGSGKTRFLSLRNLTWEPVKYKIRLDGEVGLTAKRQVKARLYHPYIYDMGTHAYGDVIEVEVLPFRTALVKLTTETERDKVALSGIPYRILNDKAGDAVEVDLLGMPGETYRVRIEKGRKSFRSASIGEASAKELLSGREVSLTFDGKKLTSDIFRHVSAMQPCEVPSDVEAIYYATVFAADNNALEVRSLQRSGETSIPQVQAARDAFFNQPLFKGREIWDRYLFDGDRATAFSISQRWGDIRPFGESGFHLDMGEALSLDKLVIESFDEYSIAPLKSYEGVDAYVSDNLRDWRHVVFTAGSRMEIDLSGAGNVRYVRFAPCPIRLCEVTGYKDGKAVNRSKWRASNLFRPYNSATCRAYHAWKSEFVIDEAAEGAYLCVAVNGYHGVEGAWAGFKIDGQYVGCPDRAPSFTSNTWEYRSADRDKNYTYYLPVTKDMVGKKIEAYVLALNRNLEFVNTDRPDDGRREGTVEGQVLKPEVWLSCYPLPFGHKLLTLENK